jgi:hypothetical protein
MEGEIDAFMMLIHSDQAGRTDKQDPPADRGGGMQRGSSRFKKQSIIQGDYPHRGALSFSFGIIVLPQTGQIQ